MDIKEIREKRDKLQETIAKLMAGFEKETSVRIVSVSYCSSAIRFKDDTPIIGECNIVLKV